MPIENCKFDFECPRQWTELARTDREGVRHCGACKQAVYYCASIEEARSRAATGACVAVDLGSPRWEGDLEGPFGERVCKPCSFDVGYDLDAYPRCGDHVRPRMTRVGKVRVT